MTLTDTMAGSLTVLPDNKQIFLQLQLRTVLRKNLMNPVHTAV